jgi:lycopene beta-cyclase
MQPDKIDIAILGGGLAGGLIALALARHRPELRLLLVDQGAHFGGNHVWSFFASDIAPGDEWLVEPLIAARWAGYEVRFPAHSRALSTAYRSATSERLDMALRAALPAEALKTGAVVGEVWQDGVIIDGARMSVGGVIDARGPCGLPGMAGGWQKFLGQMLRLDRPHGLAHPIVMDATVEQIDGYRFVYCLPFSATDIFVEDTYYADDPALDLPALRARIVDYAATQGWSVAEVVREETGVLPVVASGDFEAFWPRDAPSRAGSRAALFHPLTSYSLPDAVRFATQICRLPDLSGAALAEASYTCAQSHWRRGSFYRMLTRMLFGAAEPAKRYKMLERFYRLPEPLIQRFYAGRSTGADAVRVLAGRPPVPLTAALASLTGRGRPLASLDPTKAA